MSAQDDGGDDGAAQRQARRRRRQQGEPGAGETVECDEALACTSRSPESGQPAETGGQQAETEVGAEAWTHLHQAPDYFIVVPVLDEAAALPALLAELRGLGLLGRTLFVDNGSSDGGPELIARRRRGAAARAAARLRLPLPDGRPRGCGRGARAVVFMEADGTDDPAQVRYLVGPVLAGVADLVVGSRRRAVHGAADRPHAAASAPRQRLAGPQPAGCSSACA